jgi:hypothetical protein
MRRLVLLLCVGALAAPVAAGAATPKLALWDLQSDLAGVSRNVYGDVTVKPLRAVAGHGTEVRCAAWCRFGHGWLVFAKPPHLSAGDVATARFAYSSRRGWFVSLTLRPAALARWRAFVARVAKSARQRGVPDVLVVAVAGQIAAAPLATEVTSVRGVVTIAGFSRASAKALAAQFS